MKAVDHCRFWSPAQHSLPSQNWGWSLFFVPSSIRGNGDQKRGRESQPPPVSSGTRAGPVTPIALSVGEAQLRGLKESVELQLLVCR